MVSYPPLRLSASGQTARSTFHSAGLRSLAGRQLALACFCSIVWTVPAHAQWTQVWGDDFHGAANTTYNHSNWWNDVQPNNPWGDGALQNTSDSLQNVYLDGNNDLVIAMTYNPNNTSFPYTSARLTSRYAAGPELRNRRQRRNARNIWLSVRPGDQLCPLLAVVGRGTGAGHGSYRNFELQQRSNAELGRKRDFRCYV